MKTAAIVLAGLAVPALCDSAYGKKKLVSSEQLQRLITIEGLLAGSQKLQDIADANGGNRAFGGAGHNATVDYLYKTLKATNYYNVYKQPFVELFTAATVAFSVSGTKYEALYMTYGPSGEVTGPLVAVSNLGCAASDYPANLSGNVALISRGTCPFAEKSTLAKAAGATAAIIYNNVPGSIQGTLGGVGNYVPTVGITQEVGNTLLTAIGAGSAVATLSVKTIEENRTTYNVIAETKEGDHNNVLVLGGHTDSVFAGPGINDDGSGTIGVLKVAQALSKFKVKNAVRFAFWSAEEFGLLGSKAYLRSINGTTGGSAAEVAKVRAYLNFDMIASPNYILGIYDGDGSAFNLTGPAGSDLIERDFQDFFTKKGLPSVPTIFSGRSDYAAFLENDIPSGGLFTGAEVVKTPEEAVLFGGEAGVAYDVNYHGAGDTIDNLAKDAYLINSKAIAHSVAKYALSWGGIPKHGAINHKRTAELHQYFARFDHVHTHDHTAPCGQSAVAI